MTRNSDMRAMQQVLRGTMMTLVAFIVAVMPVLAQETTGSLRGRVVDAQGLAVPGVTVTATGPQGAKTAVTDSDGRFSVPFLTPGSYTYALSCRASRPSSSAASPSASDRRSICPA